MNEGQSIAEAARGIEYYVNLIHQLDGPEMDIRIKKFLFLRGLPEKYESASQALESQDITMGEMILRLTDIESRLREPEHANKARAEWMKTVKCHKHGKKGHITKFCKISKKDWVKKDEQNENKALGDEKSKEKPKTRRQQDAKAAQEKMIDLDSDDSDESAALATEVAEAAMLANERYSSWLIDSGATSHCTGDKLTFTSFIPYNGDRLNGVGGSPMITGRGNAIIKLPNGYTAKLRGVLMIPGMECCLLSTQALRID